jgi:hypothetical protein
MQAGNYERVEGALDQPRSMHYRIVREPRYVRADLFNRRTSGETAEFLQAVAAACLRLGCYDILVSVHHSRPVFTVEKYGFSSFVELTLKYPARVAITADTAEVRLAQEYAAMLARLRGTNVRAFRDAAAAAAWLESGRQ